MAYRELINVTNGIKAQIEVCLDALDKHKELPDEGEDLGTKLATAHSICEDILKKAGEEPEPEE